VGVIVVKVREEYRVEPRRRVRDGPVTAQMHHASPQNGVREQANATELEEHGGVAYPGDAGRRD
jgi:hypothetical protein